MKRRIKATVHLAVIGSARSNALAITPESFTEFTRQEITGKDGSPLATNPFIVQVGMSGHEHINWQIIDHRPEQERDRDNRVNDPRLQAPLMPKDKPSKPGR